MSAPVFHPSEFVDRAVGFLQATFMAAHKTTAIIAVSGGIDSAVATTLLVKALGVSQVTGLLLPYGSQDMSDAASLLNHLQLPQSQQLVFDIQPMVLATAEILGLSTQPTQAGDQLRLGNLMARARMMIVFDNAKKLDALVCGTENKSERYLGYFTRFGDSASDIEPISQLYKTQVRQVAEFLDLPEVFISKAPSAGLWPGQTDEAELGFTYDQADRVLYYLVDQHQDVPTTAQMTNLPLEVVKIVAQRVAQSQYKREVPYELPVHLGVL